MDWNLKRRKAELAIAHELAQQLLCELPSIAEQGAPPELLAHHFGLVCQRLDFAPDGTSAGRVLQYAMKEVNRRRRVLDDLVTALNRLPSPELRP
jgi:hypothetical protein